MSVEHNKDSARRKRVPDRIDVSLDLSPTIFQPHEWAEDFALMLETHKVKHRAHMESPEKQRQKATAVLKIIGHHLNQHPDLRKLDWSDSLSLIVMALDGLDAGKVEKVLEPSSKNKGRRGAPKFAPLEKEFIGFVILAHLLLVEAGFTLTGADKKIADLLTKAGFNGRQGVGFHATTVSGWRTNYPEKSDIVANRLLDRRLVGFIPRIQKMKAEGKVPEDIASWVDQTIIRSEQLRMLRPDPDTP